MLDELANISKEAFEAAKPGLIYAPYQTIISEVIVTGTGGEIRTRQKGYSRLVHGRTEDDLRKYISKDYRSEEEKAEILSRVAQDFSSTGVPVDFENLYGRYRLSGNDLYIEYIEPKRATQYIELDITIKKTGDEE